jgi:putative transposase
VSCGFSGSAESCGTGKPGSSIVLLRLAYLALTGMVTFLRLLPMSSTDKNIEILTLRHQLTVLQRQASRPRFTPADRAFPAALLHRFPRPMLRQLHLIISPDTIGRWHRTLLRRHHARRSRPKRPGQPPTVRSIRVLVGRMAHENPNWGYRRIHGELAGLSIAVAPSTLWEILNDNGIKPSPERDRLTWTTLPAQPNSRHPRRGLLRGPDARPHALTILEHATHRVRILCVTTHPIAAWTTQMARNLVMDIQDAGACVRYLIRDRDSRFPRRC